ncbi:probable cationic amino acid transporter [Toxorhynchites rutilus septentrionalis]|uniref:probable cationic amino acid transporter n=1 Tax=Toxorhynchites rutilus septentrionalis TaxID=329112 RepID=UPI0024792E46|nr:probable cationic amino acid transporter [Toxorhynchites rutilus septentrionalis]XP_055635719.1 probable cationic amino acid transporter [Toxorhynchites rutilus septentrionalis]XP_055635720.1 probable cationic amino acid transporter [Toxorhynchites rutilus septentrionalis]XP_055635721.1 probable cationic amino acid transporter [Toxorhynchites rutilus septentrionalis]XP_055635722.1 probable cationic amino acid transporter [Toxorhynchites rutilus septentrionalis]XP_055635723.1 probable cation
MAFPVGSLWDVVVSGTGGRWTMGTLILAHLIAYNETGGPGAMIGMAIGAVFSIFAGLCKSSVKSLQMYYIRTTHRTDFFHLFLAKWLDILALFSACAVLVRTLSSSLDAMTGGLVRMYILGRNSPANEPWPDVIGVMVIFLISGMFMLGLENTKIFGFLMFLGVAAVGTIIGVVTGLRGNFKQFTSEPILPEGISGLLSGAALSTFSFSNDLFNGNYCRRLLGLVVILVVLLSNELIGMCLTTLTKFSTNRDYEAVPMLAILENKDFHKAIPAIACLLVLTCSGALLELFPEMYYQIVQLTTSDWRILAKQIGYENKDSGSPILAVFTGGSLCAMLAFACPLENLIYILAASNVLATFLRAFYLLYIPFRPQYTEQQSDSSLAYSRLNSSIKPPSSQSSSHKSKKSVWFFKRPSTVSLAHHVLPSNRANKSNAREEHEREWLLLGEPPSPKAPDIPPNMESTVLSDQTSDIECIALAKPENCDTDEESSTDIDAIVDEYRQKMTVSTAGPLDSNTLRLPTATSWRFALLLIALIIGGSILTSTGLMLWEMNSVIVGANAVLIPSTILMLIPRYAQTTSTSPAVITCAVTILASTILFAASFLQSWPALLLWFFAGLFLFIRCDTWCCLCLERPTSDHHQTLIASVSGTKTTIRVPRPPKGSIIPARIVGHS